MVPAGPLTRRRPGLTLVFASIVLGGLLVAWLLRGDLPESSALVGQPAPMFTVETIDGGLFDLESYIATTQDQPLVVNLWASWCLPCREEIPAISAFAADHPEITVIGVAVQDTESASRAFATEIGAGYPLAFGNEEFEAAYPWVGLPATYVIDGSGKVVVAHNGIVDQADLEEMTEGL